MSSHPSLIADARAAIEPLRGAGGLPPRVIVGIAGAPAAGKSTLATSLATNYGGTDGPDAAIAVGMDGFHLANTELARLGLTARKGAPETFDAYGFVALLRRLRARDEPVVYAPIYSRTVHESIGSAVPVRRQVGVVIVEGNYLLLDAEPWDQVRSLLDLVIYLDTPTGVRVPSLLRRQRSRGLDRDAAYDWVYRSDEANADLVADTRARADIVLSRPA
ncbi:MAG TPA: nucleoside/nucleotide kinase family protein [Micromonosporaceae bacterium]